MYTVKKAGFKESIRNTFLKFALIPILALLLIWGGGVFAYSTFVVRRANQEANNRVADTLQLQYQSYYEMFAQVSRTPEIVNAAKGKGPANKANELLYQFNNRQKIKSIFFLYNTEGDLICTNTWDDRSVGIKRHFSEYNMLRLSSLPQGSVYQMTVYRKSQGGRNSVYTMAAPVYDGSAIAGYLVFDLLEQDFMKYVLSKQVNYLVITDEYNNAVVSNDPTVLGAMTKFNLKADTFGKVTLDDTDMYLFTGMRGDCPLRVYTLSSLAQQQQLTFFGFGLIIISSIFLYLLIRLLSSRVANKNASYLEKLVSAVEEMRTAPVPQVVDTMETKPDEFEYLTQQYQSLIYRIGDLLEKNQELSDMKRKTEIKQLQAQFNPHFIFNVLETIKYEVYLDKDEAAQTVTLLAQLLRYSIRNEKGDTVTLEQDMKYIETYLALQKIRYDERLSYHICIPRPLMKYRLPKLIIQPLVENCINHGYRNKERLTITITGTLENGHAVLRVTDNGDGITQKELQKLRARLDNPEENTANIGLLNSHRRLGLMYGEQYGLEIYSIPEMGTEVVVTFPAVYEAEEDATAKEEDGCIKC